MQATPSAIASSAPTRRFEKVFSPPGMAVEMTSRTQCQVFIFEDYTATQPQILASPPGYGTGDQPIPYRPYRAGYGNLTIGTCRKLSRALGVLRYQFVGAHAHASD